jgi:hypothetical protein
MIPIFFIPTNISSHIFWYVMDKHGENAFIILKIFKGKVSTILYGYFYHLRNSLRWFLVVPPKDVFAQSVGR